MGGGLALAGAASAEQLTAFCFYSEFLASALLSVCDQWGPIMEASPGCVDCCDASFQMSEGSWLLSVCDRWRPIMEASRC